MLKRFLSLFISSLLCITLLALGTAQAQAPAAINLPFNATTDGVALQPTGRPVSDTPYDNSRVVIGNDERRPILTRAYPWSAIGRLEWHVSGAVIPWCTATLIGNNLLLTNSHCLERPILDPRTNRFTVDSTGKLATQFTDASTYQSISDRLIFKPSLIRGVALDEATVISYQSGWTASAHDAISEDWALLKIDANLGDSAHYGNMGWRSLDFSDANTLSNVKDKIKLAGYSGDFPTEKLREFGAAQDTAGVDMACSILGVNDGVLIHDCDTYPGASGSAILGKFEDGNYYVLGLHRGSFTLGQTATLPDGVATNAVNLGVQVSRWATQALAMR